MRPYTAKVVIHIAGESPEATDYLAAIMVERLKKKPGYVSFPDVGEAIVTKIKNTQACKLRARDRKKPRK